MYDSGITILIKISTVFAGRELFILQLRNPGGDQGEPAS